VRLNSRRDVGGKAEEEEKHVLDGCDEGKIYDLEECRVELRA